MSRMSNEEWAQYYYEQHGVRFAPGTYEDYLNEVVYDKPPRKKMPLDTIALLFYMTGSLMFFAGSLCLWFK